MKMTDELKGKLQKASSGEETKKILDETRGAVAKAGIILEDDELVRVAGGTGEEIDVFSKYKVSPNASWCPHCERNVEGDGLGPIQEQNGISYQVFLCDNCGGEYVVKY